MRAFHLFQPVPDAAHQMRIDNGDRAAIMAVRKARFGQIDDALSAGLYRHAASLMAYGEEDAFARTQDLDDRPWREREGILEVSPQAREMDVGDIIIDTENGDGWMCASIGWEVLSWDRCSQFLQIAVEKNLGKISRWAGEPDLMPEPA